MSGRIGHGLIPLFIHIKILSTMLLIFSIALIYSIIPALVAHNTRINNKSFFLTNSMFSFVIIGIFSLLFPWESYIINDFFITTLLLNLYISDSNGLYICNYNLVFSYGTSKIDFTYVHTSNTFFVGFVCSIHSELMSLNMIGMIIGVYILAFIRYKKFYTIPLYLVALYLGIIIGTLIVLTSLGVLNALFNPDNFRIPTTFTHTMQIIQRQIFLIAFILLTTIFILIGILVLCINKTKNTKDFSFIDFIWKSIYLICIFIGLNMIFFISRVPYLHTFMIVPVFLPLIYLIITLVLKIYSFLPDFWKYLYQSVSLMMMCYIITFSLYNVTLVQKITNDFSVRLSEFENTKAQGKFIIPVYLVSYKHTTDIIPNIVTAQY